MEWGSSVVAVGSQGCGQQLSNAIRVVALFHPLDTRGGWVDCCSTAVKAWGLLLGGVYSRLSCVRVLCQWDAYSRLPPVWVQYVCVCTWSCTYVRQRCAAVWCMTEGPL